MGLVDADHKFLWAWLGAERSASDAGIFNRSVLEPAFREGTLGLPPADAVRVHPPSHAEHMIHCFGMMPFGWECSSSSHSPKGTWHERGGLLTTGAQEQEESMKTLLVFWPTGSGVCYAPAKRTLWNSQENKKKILRACLTLHNLMTIRYSNLHNADLNAKDINGHILPVALRADGCYVRDGGCRL